MFENLKATLYNAVLQSRTSSEMVDLNINGCFGIAVKNDSIWSKQGC